MNVTVCIGSSCHLKGAREVVEILQKLLEENNLTDKVQLSGTFCIGNCRKGVCVTVDKQVFSLSPHTTEEFFETEILNKL